MITVGNPQTGGKWLAALVSAPTADGAVSVPLSPKALTPALHVVGY